MLYEPELLPVPRYPSDHTGRRRELTDADLDKWRELGASADVFFDFDWLEPESMPRRMPGSSLDSGHQRRDRRLHAPHGPGRQRLDDSGLVVTTAAGIHAVPLAEFAVAGALYFVKGIPQLRRRQDARHWERYATRQLAGLRCLVVGLGGIGRAVVASFAGLGVEVWGLGRDGGVL